MLLLPYIYIGSIVIGFGYLLFYAEYAYISGFTKRVQLLLTRYNILCYLNSIGFLKAMCSLKYN